MSNDKIKFFRETFKDNEITFECVMETEFYEGIKNNISDYLKGYMMVKHDIEILDTKKWLNNENLTYLYGTTKFICKATS